MLVRMVHVPAQCNPMLQGHSQRKAKVVRKRPDPLAALIPSPRLHPHARLAAVAASLRAGTLDPETREQLAESLERIAGGEDAATVLGVKRAPGQRTLRTYAALAERDRLLREAAERFLGGLSVAAQADCLHKQLSRYSASAWQRERVCEQCPDRHRGTIYECFGACSSSTTVCSQPGPCG